MVLIERFLLGALLVVALCATVNHAASISTSTSTTTSTTLTTTTENVPPTVSSTTTESGDEAQKETNRTDGRTENARSLDLDISKYTSTDFHNKVYDVQTSPDNEKFISHEVSKVHTTFRTSFTSQNANDYDNYELTTPSSKLFDEKHKALQSEIKKRLEIEEHVDESTEQLEETPTDSADIAKTNKTNLDFVRYSNILSDDDVRNKTSIHRNYETEKGLNLNYESVYNQSDVVHNDDKIPLLNNKIENDKAAVGINISKRDFTNAKSANSTGNAEQPQSNLLPSIETSTNHEQTQQENNIYPVLVPLPLTTTTTSTTTESNTKLYEMTENDFATTTEFAFDAGAPRDDDESDEKFYEMTVSTTIPDIETTTTSPITTSTTTRTSTPASVTEQETEESESVTTSTVPATTVIADEDATTIGSVSGTTDEIKTTTELIDEVTPASSTEEVPTTIATRTNTTENDNLITSGETTTTTEIAGTTEIDATSITTERIEETTLSLSGVSANNETTEPVETTTTFSPDPITTTEYVETTTILNESNAIIKEHNATETTSRQPSAVTASPSNEIKKDNASTNEQNLDDFMEEFPDDYIDLQHRKDKEKPIVIDPKGPNQTVTEITTITTIADETTTTENATVSTSEEVIDPETSNSGTIIAIVLSTVGAICLILLAILLFVMRRRQKRFNYGQRCTPVSLDAYSMDNVSVYNSVRRKAAMRASKRSYGNPAFDDDTSVSHPLNFQAIIRFANNVEDIKTEFEEIPQVNAKMNELPDGCDTKNRYANVIPLPESRVYLTLFDDDPTSDYINANYVTGPKGVRGYYIACQAPLHNTVNDFWRMIWEQQSKVILMVTHLFENGVEKCVDYLPPSEVVDCHRLFGDYQVTLKKREVKDKYIISSLQLKNMVSNSWREVTHLWYSGWPEKGVPEEENSLIAFLIEARSYVKFVQNVELKENASSNGRSNQDPSPVVVHCSPGTGRTGTVIACDIAIREFELRRIIDVPRIVYRIRRDRASSVQTKDQYHFIYKVINLYATKLTGGALDSI